ncbi:MAG: hypothetical protein JO236_07845 [Mycobacterium sp.]|uniref:hypothetical protein n=1 Tax=Mycobacterium sp. TaxID=1785 RepID=UPI001EB67DC2|nr:hypothetical protein [Mycobacterium sp.]MBW0017439.1 hypothetical protein [Mycobacterium sp.]
MIEPTLAAAAFGNAPETWPLPTAVTPHQLWLRAVASGGQGRYGSAYRDLAEIRRAAAGPVTSLAHSTQGSFLRQLGWHALARRWDGRALALAGADPAARADALIGLAADALGIGRFALAATLLARVDPDWVGDRVAVRRQWVAAELAMATGDGAVAVGHAERAVELARATAGVRHQVKSDVVLAAALCSAGHIDRASAVGAAALETAGQRGLIPLKWALACLLIDTGSVTVPVQPMRELTQIRDICAGQMQRAGGIWRTA